MVPSLSRIQRVFMKLYASCKSAMDNTEIVTRLCTHEDVGKCAMSAVGRGESSLGRESVNTVRILYC